MIKKLTFLLVMLPLLASAQEEGESSRRSRLTLGIGHTIVGQGVDDKGSRSWRALPMWVIDYDYSLSSRWSIGIHSDLIMERFKVEGYFLEPENTAIERHYPVAGLAAASFKPGRHSIYSIGMGGEFSDTGNYYMTRLGFEYGFELPGDWELAPSLTYDIKWKAYDSFSISLAVGKKF